MLLTLQHIPHPLSAQLESQDSLHLGSRTLGGLLWSLLPLPTLQTLDQWWLDLLFSLKQLSLDRGSKGPQTRTEDSSEPYFQAPKYVLKHQECIAKWCPAQQKPGSLGSMVGAGEQAALSVPLLCSQSWCW